MLDTLQIKHLAIIDHLHINFSSGLNVITGETGAGKSIIVNAVKLLLGERATAEFIRHGEEAATIEALFRVEDKNRQANLKEMGFEDCSELLIKRVISRSGKNKVFINGQLATLQILQQVVSLFLTLSGQHEYQTLLLPTSQLEILDEYAELKQKKTEFQGCYKVLVETLRKKENLSERLTRQKEKKELLDFQLQEIERANLQPAEEEVLIQEKSVLRHAEFLKQVAEEGYFRLYGGEGAVTEILAALEKSMEMAVGYEPKWQAWLDVLKECFYQLEDLAQALNDYKQHFQFEPEELDRIEARLAEIVRLKKKYKVQTITELLEVKENIAKELVVEENLSASLEELKREIDVLRDKLKGLKDEITHQRYQAAESLRECLETYLHELGIFNARWEIRLTLLNTGLFLKEKVYVNENGAEEAEFLFSPNVGEPLKPLAKIASGGELSRVLLAIKAILGKKTHTETVIFDEIDVGVGGDMGNVIGRRLKKLAANHQVICITHLPQIACYGNAHFKVEKEIRSGRTITTVCLLDKDKRVKELVRMLGGKASSHAYAEILLNQPNKQ